ncbi:hypothetical protein SAMN02910298_00543 [Pseudobutyrivibrio sp. YE44]|uniref:hypothetical protein n=1 Tax=Pseudobutyrivibrio sp. YE44 TaxID=1520802 RepID=UPI0008884B3B|nr:hypothetical protein [Pseudobutyrivibrio sp. YE44]SDB10985.1 hypothetical protein SAMN02910298_00543 [Pseudobutyrivibrio sp. YE44]
MNTKPIPIIITLAAAFISCVMSIVQDVDFSVFVGRLVVVVLIFMFLGTVIKLILDYAFRTLEPVSIDGEPSEEDAMEDEEGNLEDVEASQVGESESGEG